MRHVACDLPDNCGRYPSTQKILLIWDHAPAHDSTEVQEFLNSVRDRLVTCLIPGGLTSVLQVCDLCCNAQLKNHFMLFYNQWRVFELAKQKRGHDLAAATAEDRGLPAPSQSKMKLNKDRSVIIKLVERSFREFNRCQMEKPPAERAIVKTFARAGQDPDADLQKFHEHLDGLSECSVYQRTRANQCATHVENASMANVSMGEITRALQQVSESLAGLSM